jgi:hypothetical protein
VSETAVSTDHQLSTGHDVTLPLSCRARVGGVVLAADWAPLRAALPDDFTPIRVGPRRGAVTVAGVDYVDVDAGALEPYGEFAVIVPVARDGFGGVPTSLSGVGGYVVDLPVTTEPARALGDLWGFPKSVTEVDVEATPRTVTTRVDADGRPDVELTVDVGDAGARRLRQQLVAYTYLDDRLTRVPVDIDCQVRVSRDGRAVTLARGAGRYASVLTDLGLRPRVYAQFVASSLSATIHPPDPVD